MIPTALDPHPADRAAALVHADPRVLALCAPPGYGKSEVLRRYGEFVGSLVVCELPESADVATLARAVVDALVEGQGARSARSAADRLAQRRERVGATSRETLRREWPVENGAEVFVLYDPANTLATPAGADLLSELVGGFPAARRLAISMRTALPPALAQIIMRERATTVTAVDLALRLDDATDMARRAGLPQESAQRLYEITRGWPLALELLIPLAAIDSVNELLDAAAAVPHVSLLHFAAHRAITALGTGVREALVITTLLRGAGHLDLLRVLGDECDDAIFARMIELPFVTCSGDRAAVHPEIAQLLRTRFEPLVKTLYRRTLDVLTGDGAYVDAARIALGAGEIEHAAAIIDAAPPYTAAPVPLGAYERIIGRIDPDLITRYPNMWIATRPYRSFSVDRVTYIREAETVYYCLPPAANADQRAAVLMHLASAYVNVGRAHDADLLLEEALTGFASASSKARASILNLAASLRGIEGHFSIARSLAQQASAISRDAFGETQTLHYIELHEAVYRGKHDRFIVIMDELLRRRSREELPLYTAYAAGNGAIFSWVAGDDDAFQRYLALAEDAVTPGLSAGFGPILEAARGRPHRLDAEYTWPLVEALANLFGMWTSANDREALAAARTAVRAADERGDPFIQALAHVALYVLDEGAREAQSRALLTIAETIESPELHEAIRNLVEGRSPGMLEPFVRRRVRRERAHTQPRITVELLAGRVYRDGTAIRLTDKEFELIAFLASSRGAVSRDRIGEALWEHLDPEEWRNNFKVTLHRVRTRLAFRDVVLVDERRYRLAPAVELDLRRAERVVRESATGTLDGEARDELNAIVSAYRGGSAARYERFAWGQPLLAHINDVTCNAGIALATDALARAAHDEALRYAGEVTAIDPFNERACETVVRILIDRGDVDGARREFRRYATALADELGAAPSQMLADLVRHCP